MASSWQSCPHCKVVFQTDSAKNPAPRDCPACKRPLFAAAVAPVRIVAATAAPAARSIPASAATIAVPVSPSAPAGWFYVLNKKKVGPVPLAQLKQLANAGQLQAGDMVLQEGTQKWLPLGTLPGMTAAPAPVVRLAPAHTAPRPAALPVAPANGNFPVARPVAPPPNNGPPAPRPTPVARGWHYARDRKKHGPLSRAHLQELLAKGQLTPADMVLPEGSAKWVRASAVPGLCPPPAAPPAPPPAAVPVSAAATPPSPKVPPITPASETPGPDPDLFERTEILAPREVRALPPRPRATSPRACNHCKGTAFCGRYWDTDGMVECGPVCADCKVKSGIDPSQEATKVTCAVCGGKGFLPAPEETPSPEDEVPPDAAAWRLRALAASDRGDYEQAIAAYTEALHLEPSYADAYYERGWAYMATGATDLADADLAEAARLSPRYASDDRPTTESQPSGWLGRLFRR